MKLKKAIEIVNIWQEGGEITSFDDVNRAVKLLIEAGKRISGVRERPTCWAGDLLPGETEE